MRNLPVRWWQAVVLAAAVCGCRTGGIRPEGPVSLAYGGRAGVTRTWKLEQVLRGEFSFGGMPQLLVITLHGTLNEAIDEVTPEGRRHVTQKWAFDPLEFNGMAVPLEQVPRQVESQALRSPDGEMEALDRSAAETDLLAWVARSIGGFVPRLPDHPVPAGESWSRTATLDAGGGAEFLQTATGTFTGMEDDTALLTTTGGLALTRTAAGLDAFDLDFSGRTKFATEEGYVSESKQDGTLSCKSRTGKAPLTIRARFTSTLTVKP